MPDPAGDDLTRLRERAEDARPDEPEPGTGGAAARLGRVTTVVGSLGANKYFRITPQTLSGPEVEGGAGTLTPGSGSSLVLARGGAPPPSGLVVATQATSGRWVWTAEKPATTPETPCTTPQSAVFAVGAGCCSAVGTAISLALPDTTVIGTCTTVAGIGGPANCSISFTQPVGTVLTWTATKSPYPVQTGTFAAVCGASSVSVTLWHVDSLPDTIHVSDPLGNAVPISRVGAIPGSLDYRTWRGSHTYSLSGYGAPDVEVEYTWLSCNLTLKWLSAGVNHNKAITFLPGEGTTCDSGNTDLSPSAPAWHPAPAGTIQCEPLLITYEAWPDFGISTLGQLVESGCACKSPFFNLQFSFSGSYYLFPCKSIMTVTL